MLTATEAFTRIVFPIAWRWPGRAARMLFEFALAEQATMLDMWAAAARTSSAERRALYLRHALDEREEVPGPIEERGREPQRDLFLGRHRSPPTRGVRMYPDYTDPPPPVTPSRDTSGERPAAARGPLR